MNAKVTLLILVSASLAAIVSSRDLKVKIINGAVPAKDMFTSDPYVSVTVCEEKVRTHVVEFTRTPVWNWSHRFSNVNDRCRIKFHIYDDDSLADDDLGIFQVTVGQLLSGGKYQSIRVGKSVLNIVIKYDD